MRTIKFPEEMYALVDSYMATIKREYREEESLDPRRLSFKFSYTRIVNNDELYKSIVNHLKPLGYKSLKGLRIDIFEGDHYISKHEDSAFKGHDTLIVPIEVEVSDQRLRVWPVDNEHSFLVDEQPLKGIVLEEGTIYEITKAEIVKHRRITLCGWISKEL